MQARLTDNLQGKQRATSVRSPSLLAGKVFDEAGEPLVATHALKGKVRYRSYVSRSLQHQLAVGVQGMRIPAKELEGAVVARFAEALDNPRTLVAAPPTDGAAFAALHARAGQLAEELRRKNHRAIRPLVQRVGVHAAKLRITPDRGKLAKALGLGDLDATLINPVLSSAVRLKRTGVALRLVQPSGASAIPREADRSMIELLVNALRWWAKLSEGELTIIDLAHQEGINTSWLSRVVRLNFLASELIDSILAGSQPPVLNAARLTSAGPLPLYWNEQIEHLTAC